MIINQPWVKSIRPPLLLSHSSTSSPPHMLKHFQSVSKAFFPNFPHQILQRLQCYVYHRQHWRNQKLNITIVIIIKARSSTLPSSRVTGGRETLETGCVLFTTNRTWQYCFHWFYVNFVFFICVLFTTTNRTWQYLFQALGILILSCCANKAFCFFPQEYSVSELSRIFENACFPDL